MLQTAFYLHSINHRKRPQTSHEGFINLSHNWKQFSSDFPKRETENRKTKTENEKPKTCHETCIEWARITCLTASVPHWVLLHISLGIERCFYGIFIARSIKMLIQYALRFRRARRLWLCFLSLPLFLSLPSLSLSLSWNSFEPIWGIVINARFLAPC